jgi:phosphate transport system substrate-binding protein
VRRVSIAAIAGLCLALIVEPVWAQDGLRLTGSGATFPFPLYSAWFKSFSGKHKGVTVDYQGKGSGAGVR